MDNRLKAAFGVVHAEAALKERTASFLAQKTGDFQKKKRSGVPRLVPILACCVLVLLVSLGAGWAYFTPVSAISIDVNPSLELSINRFDRVLSVTGKNPDGEALAEHLKLTFLSYEDALHQILDDSSIQKLLRQDDPMSIVVVCPNQQHSDEMLATVKNCVGTHHGAAGHHNVSCHAGNSEEAAAAQEAGLPLGKYQVFLELQALDPSLTPEDVQGKTMRELRDMLAALSEESSQPADPSLPEDNTALTSSAAPSQPGTGTTPTSSCEPEHNGSGNGMGQGQGNGQGQGQGQGNGQGRGHGRGMHHGGNHDS